MYIPHYHIWQGSRLIISHCPTDIRIFSEDTKPPLSVTPHRIVNLFLLK